ncbi:hypothetical protein K525DRAFT_275485 [Schizophyllum commune Loenen D]|nr:hypothetical protein K525DRAFT_275485 [Schizophyllum commune Loenen D]
MQARIAVLEAENRTLRTNYDGLLDAIRSLPTSTSAVPTMCPSGQDIYFTDNMGNILTAPPTIELSKDDYSSVKFWEKNEYYSSNGKLSDVAKQLLKASSNPHGQMYLEYADGTTIDTITAGQIRTYARQLYHELRAKDLAPDTWGQAPSASL